MLGVLSLVFWAMTFVITFKYLAFVMRADNRGQGGILALMALVGQKDISKKGRSALLVLGLFGAALLYGDGVITPAISVLGAVEGVAVAAPGLGHLVVPLAVAILVAPVPVPAARHPRGRRGVRAGDGGLVRHHRRARDPRHRARAARPARP